MAGISKRIRSSWVSSDYGVMKTDTDTITTLPAVIYPNAATATVGLKGNMSQTGTPTSQNPIQPSECGERTGNLCPITSFDKTTDVYYSVLFDTPIPAGTYTISAEITATSTESRISFRKADVSQIIASNMIIQTGRSQLTVTLNEPCYGMYIYGGTTVFDNIPIKYENLMLNVGSTALPYEPYGVKIPVLSGGVTTNVYLGEVETTRKIKKYVITGLENTWIATAASPSGRNRFYLPLESALSSDTSTPLSICSHLPLLPTGGTYTTDNGYTIANSNVYIRLTSDYNSLADFKTYLQQQYAAGTPVTIWYVLATPETAVVNEPLMRIGGYADTLSNVSIPVTAGGDTISVGTTLPPREVTINYKGWHPKTPKESNDGSWT